MVTNHFAADYVSQRNLRYRSSMISRAILALSILVIATSCRSGGGSSPVAALPPGTGAFTLVVLHAGDRSAEDVARADVAAAYRQHRTFLGNETRAKRLLLTGPVSLDDDGGNGPGGIHGLFVFDSADVEEVRARVFSDAAVELGLFRPECISLMTLDVIRGVPAEVLERESNGSDDERRDLKGYVVVLAPDGEAAAAAMRSPALARHIVLLGRCGAPRDRALFAVLDVSDPRQVRARATIAEANVEDWQILRWTSSPALAEVMGRLRANAGE